MVKKIMMILLVAIMALPIFGKVTYISYSDEFNVKVQYNTGSYSGNNCGAASLYMCLDYMNIDLGTVEQLRNKIRPQDGWIWTYEIEEVLDKHEIEYKTKKIYTKDSLITALNDGVLMICTDASKISGKEYYNITGHFMVIVGYKNDDRGEHFEVYDPLSYNKQYYKADEVFESAKEWWGWFFLFEKGDINGNEDNMGEKEEEKG